MAFFPFFLLSVATSEQLLVSYLQRTVNFTLGLAVDHSKCCGFGLGTCSRLIRDRPVHKRMRPYEAQITAL